MFRFEKSLCVLFHIVIGMNYRRICLCWYLLQAVSALFFFREKVKALFLFYTYQQGDEFEETFGERPTTGTIAAPWRAYPKNSIVTTTLLSA